MRDEKHSPSVETGSQAESLNKELPAAGTGRGAGANEYTLADKELGLPQNGEATQGVDDQDPNRSLDDLDDEEQRDAALESGTSGRPVHKIASVNNVASIPNGGLKAWLQVAGAFVLFLNTWGVMNTFGVYQTYYEIDILRTTSPSAISWIGSIQAFLLMLVGALTGPVYDAGYFRELVLTGSFLVVFGHMMLSLCKEYYQVLLAQAFCIGLGTGCLFVPSVAILSTYFNTRLALAMGLAAAGSSLGGVIYPIMLHRLIPSIGFAWSVRTIGFVMLATFAVPNTVMKVRVLPAKKRAVVDATALRSLPYMLFVLGSLIGFMGLYTPFFYVQYYSIAAGITDQNLGFYLLAILNSASVFGRIIPNFVADRTGPMNIIIPCALISGLLIFCLIPIRSAGPMVVFNLLYGFFSGSFVSLPPTILVHLTPNRALIGTRMGMCFSVVSVGVLVGTPIAGAILNASGFTSVWIFGGTLTVAGGLIMLGSRVAYKGLNPLTKA